MDKLKRIIIGHIVVEAIGEEAVALVRAVDATKEVVMEKLNVTEEEVTEVINDVLNFVPKAVASYRSLHSGDRAERIKAFADLPPEMQKFVMEQEPTILD